jgi:alkanesulfonate monooxygenase SsuD/methylene tetrahydromethanopterin reductase-like flavin-dependent oxidoreductase (luciferase family)
MTVVDIQLSPANTDWATLKAATVTAEQHGFGAVLVFDHLAGLPLGGATMLECFALLGALSEVTERVELGTMVANVWNRQVGTLVSAAASVAIMSGRQFHLGIGAGTSPTSSWAAEQTAVEAHVEPSLEARHTRVQEVLDLTARLWSADRETSLATFPLPTPPPSRIVGVNSVRLSRIAGVSADGINVPWRHPRRDEFLAVANNAAGNRPFLRTAYTAYDAALLDPDHPDRLDMTERRIDRLVLSVFDSLDEWIEATPGTIVQPPLR